MRYYNRVLTLTGYEICSLRDLLCDYGKDRVISAIDKIIDEAIDEGIILDSKIKSSFDFNNNLSVVNGNRSSYDKMERWYKDGQL